MPRACCQALGLPPHSLTEGAHRQLGAAARPRGHGRKGQRENVGAGRTAYGPITSNPPAVELGTTHCSQPSPLLLTSLNAVVPQMARPIKTSRFHRFPDGEAGQRGKGTCPRAPAGLRDTESSFCPPSSLFCHLTLPLPLPPHWVAPVSHFLSPSCLQLCLGLPGASPLPSFALPLLPLLSSPGPWSQGRLLTSLWPMFSLLVPPSLSWDSSQDGQPLPFHCLPPGAGG